MCFDWLIDWLRRFVLLVQYISSETVLVVPTVMPMIACPQDRRMQSISRLTASVCASLTKVSGQIDASPDRRWYNRRCGRALIAARDSALKLVSFCLTMHHSITDLSSVTCFFVRLSLQIRGFYRSNNDRLVTVLCHHHAGWHMRELCLEKDYKICTVDFKQRDLYTVLIILYGGHLHPVLSLLISRIVCIAAECQP